MRTYLLASLLSIFCNGCAVVAVADAAVSVVAQRQGRCYGGWKPTVDVAAAGVKAVAGSAD